MTPADRLARIRARAEAARGLQSTRAQQEDFNHNALFDILALLAAIDELEAFGTELAAALKKHRADMHNTSNRPCPTCRQSAKALAAWDARPCVEDVPYLLERIEALEKVAADARTAVHYSRITIELAASIAALDALEQP